MLLSFKTWQERGLKNIQNTLSKKMCQTSGQKGRSKTWFFLIFWGLGPKAPQGGPKDPPDHPPKANFVNNFVKMVSSFFFTSMTF